MQVSARFASSAASKRVIAGISSTTTRSGYGVCRGKSHVASLSAQESPKGQKRITKEERRVRIEAFVEKYRASNAGKFPSTSTVRQQVGGSYYAVREKVQELEYNHKMFPTEKFKTVQLHETSELDNVSSDVKEEQSHCSNIQSTSTDGNDTPFVEVVEKIEIDEHSRPKDDAGNNYFDLEKIKEKQAFDDVRNISINYTSTSTNNIEKAEASVSLGLKTASDLPNYPGETEGDKLDLNSTENLKSTSGPIVSEQMESDKVLRPEKLYSEHRPEHEHEGSSTKTNIWGNLKSFADGIMNLWKKL